MDHPISTRRPDLVIINNQKKEHAVPADYTVKLKDSEKNDKYLDLIRELKNLRNMRVTIIPIEIGTLSTVNEGLSKGLEDL